MFSFFIIEYTESQHRYQIYGTVSDMETGEQLGGVVVYSRSADNIRGRISGVTNAFGYYRLELGEAEKRVIGFSHLGYRDTAISITFSDRSEIRLDVRLFSKTIYVDQVVVEGARPLYKLQAPLMSTFSIDVSNYKAVPSIGGEMDISKFLQLTPGVAVGQEGSNALYVRGGSGDQNLLLLDGATVYNPDHLFGFLSVFNSDAIRRVSLLKGGIPAEYGGRLSSIYSMEMKEGANDRIRFSGGISLLSSRMMLEGPISFSRSDQPGENDSKGSFMVSARRTYIDPLLNLMKPSGDNSELSFYFYDINLKANYNLDSENRLFVSGYFGSDVLHISADVADETTSPGALKNINLDLDGGNYAYHIRFNRLWSPDLFSNFSIVLSRYRFNSNLDFGTVISKKNPAITDVTARGLFDYSPGKSILLKFGGELTRHRYEAAAGINELTADEKVNLEALESVGFASLEWKIVESLSSSTGVRVTSFSKGEYLLVEPRWNVSWLLNETSSLKASFTRMNQFTHLLSSASFSSPSDVWYPSTSFMKPQSSDQVTVGWLQFIPGASGGYEYEFSADVFLKTYDHLPMFRQSFASSEEKRLREDLIFGTGKSYGIELMIKKEAGELNGIASYSFSHTERTFAEKNKGLPFTPRFDRPHILNAFVSYKLSDGWILSSTFVLTSGQPVTIPRQKYFISGPHGEYEGNDPADVPIDYGQIYSFRLPAYNRMDVSAAHTFTGWGGEWELNFSIYNLYGYPNPLFVDFNDPYSDTFTSKTSVGLLPSIGILAKF